MGPLTSYLFIFLTVLIANIIPAFMPPTWLLLVLFAVNLKLPVLEIILVGLAGAALGRMALYYLSSDFFSKLLSQKRKDHMRELGEILNTKRRMLLPLILTFSVLPVPSDDVFIAAGLAKFDLKVLVTAFIIGRFIIFLLIVSTSTLASPELISRINASITGWQSLVFAAIGVGMVLLLSEISWKHLMRLFFRKFLSSQT